MSRTRITDTTSGAGDAADLEVAIASWDYGPSVERSRVHLGEWKQKTIDFCRELYIARQALSRGLAARGAATLCPRRGRSTARMSA